MCKVHKAAAFHNNIHYLHLKALDTGLKLNVHKTFRRCLLIKIEVATLNKNVRVCGLYNRSLTHISTHLKHLFLRA